MIWNVVEMSYSVTILGSVPVRRKRCKSSTDCVPVTRFACHFLIFWKDVVERNTSVNAVDESSITR